MNLNTQISIIVAAYNAEKYIEECIDSILCQTFREFELIIINDGSTDKTEEKILNYNDERIIYIKNSSNLKLIASLNIGLKHAKGKYIARMDADDICYKDRLQIQFEFMESHPEIGISGCDLELFGDNIGSMTYPKTDGEIKLGLLITSTFGNNVIIFRREIFIKHNLYFKEGYLHAEDYKLWTEWSMHTQMYNLKNTLVKYRIHNESISNKYRTVQRNTRNQVRKEYLEFLFDIKNPNIALNFYGTPSKRRINAIHEVLSINKEKNIFNEHNFKEKIIQLWYLDSLEYVEESIKSIFAFRYILWIDFSFYNLKNYLFVIKHYLKCKIKK